MAALAKNENQVSEYYGRKEVEIGNLFCVVAGKDEAHRSESRVGRMRRSFKSGFAGMVDLFLMQDDFTDDGASGQCLQLEGMSVGEKK